MTGLLASKICTRTQPIGPRRTENSPTSCEILFTPCTKESVFSVCYVSTQRHLPGGDGEHGILSKCGVAVALKRNKNAGYATTRNSRTYWTRKKIRNSFIRNGTFRATNAQLLFLFSVRIRTMKRFILLKSLSHLLVFL